MKFKRIDKGITSDGKFYRTTFQSEGDEIVDIDVDVEVDAAHRDPELRVRHEQKAMEEHGIAEHGIAEHDIVD